MAAKVAVDIGPALSISDLAAVLGAYGLCASLSTVGRLLKRLPPEDLSRLEDLLRIARGQVRNASHLVPFFPLQSRGVVI
jgi:hypothetical protein